MKLLKITPEGEFSIVETTSENFLDTCYREIDCRSVEFHSCMGLPPSYRLIVDTCRLFKEDRKPNPLPWLWYSDLNPFAPIVGTVLVGKVIFVGPYRERDIGGLDEDDIVYFSEWESAVKTAFYKEI